MKTTYRFRLKDKHAPFLEAKARAVNFIWNFCNETQKHALKWGKRWPSGYDLQKLCAGSSQEIDLRSKTIDRVCAQYETSRKQHKKATLRWRSRKSLGWIPFAKENVRFKEGAFHFMERRLDAWVSRSLVDGLVGTGSFNQDSAGHWYINFVVEDAPRPSKATQSVGIDLGLKDLLTTSDGIKEAAPQWFRRSQDALGTAQRAHKKRRAAAIHRRIANTRKDHLHKLTTAFCRENGAIFVGNVSAAKLAKTKMAKSVLDASWTTFRNQLEYKAIRHQVVYREVNEAFSTQTCSCCGAIGQGSPKGRAGLGIREWTCTECGSVHDRDINAAKNILALGLKSLAGGAFAVREEQSSILKAIETKEQT